MEFTFLGGAVEVGASCTHLEVAGHYLLIDGGIRTATKKGQSRLPDLSLLNARPPEAFLITHAHIDQIGGLPLITSLYPHAPIYATESTRILTEILLSNSVKIMEQEGLKPDSETPLYTTEQVEAFLARIKPISSQQPFAPIASAPALTVRYLPAGHILGASMLFFDTPEGTLLYTGDISVTDQRAIKGLDPQNLPRADIMISEGTYGHISHCNRKEEEQQLVEIVQSVLARGGRIILPAFALGRSQEVVLGLKAFRALGQISPVPIYLDGTVRSICTAYEMQSHDLRPSLRRALINSGRPLFSDPGLSVFEVQAQDREALVNSTDPMIVISSSGMLSGGASPLYVAAMAAREQDAIIFSGYQDEECPKETMLQTKQGGHLRLDEQVVSVNCQVARYNLSIHANASEIVHVVTKVAPKRLILVHGTSESLKALARRFSKIQVDIPVRGTTLQIATQSTFVPLDQRSHIAMPSTVVLDAPPTATDELISPTIDDLWRIACERGPTHTWTAVELGQQYYGTIYGPTLHAQIEHALKEASLYFKQGRTGSRRTYLPRSVQETQQLRPLLKLFPGEIVLVQGQETIPQIALLLSEVREGTVSMITDQWKQGFRSINLIQLVPSVQREDLLTVPIEDVKQQLFDWRQALKDEWIDLFTRWEQCQGEEFTFASLCASLPTEDLRLIWGLELLAHGDELFERNGSTWRPFSEQQIAANVSFAHHLALRHAGTHTPILVNGRKAKLTGRSSWLYFEVCWEEGAEAGECRKVRRQNIQLVPR